MSAEIVKIDVGQVITDGYDNYEVVLRDENNYVIKCVHDRQDNGENEGYFHIIPHRMVVNKIIGGQLSYHCWLRFECTDRRLNRLLTTYSNDKKHALVMLANTREMVDLVNPEPHPRFIIDFSDYYANQGAITD